MKPQTFTQQVNYLVCCCDEPSKLKAKRLNEHQKDRLAAAYMRSLGKHADEVLETSGMLDDILGKLIVYLEASAEERKEKELAQGIIDALVTSAHEGSEKAIDDCIGEADTLLAYKRQHWHDDYTAEQMLAEDNASRARDMNADRKVA